MLDLFVGLGSNLGDRAAHLAHAREALAAYYELIAASPIYETPALMPEGAPDDWNIPFLNQVVQFRSDAAAADVLQIVKAVEKVIGRAPSARWAPRVIDIDIVAYGATVLAGDGLNIPHAHMHLRDFVLVPFCDIAPDWRLPEGHALAGATIRALRDRLPRIEVKPYDAH